jgi:hypothetical protein
VQKHVVRPGVGHGIISLDFKISSFKLSHKAFFFD